MIDQKNCHDMLTDIIKEPFTHEIIESLVGIVNELVLGGKKSMLAF